jgi:hypothetical protein
VSCCDIKIGGVEVAGCAAPHICCSSSTCCIGIYWAYWLLGGAGKGGEKFRKVSKELFGVTNGETSCAGLSELVGLVAGKYEGNCERLLGRKPAVGWYIVDRGSSEDVVGSLSHKFNSIAEPI